MKSKVQEAMRARHEHEVMLEKLKTAEAADITIRLTDHAARTLANMGVLIADDMFIPLQAAFDPAKFLAAVVQKRQAETDALLPEAVKEAEDMIAYARERKVVDTPA